ncbi:XRE family transcriptional regulator [Virgibacillus sp. NKC19-16]|uniref:helix-turn-helix domain-containing protein n=1 Tax=Virgibacillus salidurans TaxID=2831673 RepID=UPI001F29E055|nr:helix-turn-helix domain-containing protein [Virgibacillus sp. NKC19-16]UJL45509.1 XRE family transcriptional regulator [Virgibacillus sp. NKC19-16]
MEGPQNIENHELRAQLISLRLKLDLTQKEFADLVGVKQPLISRLENVNQNITVNKLQQILARTKTGAKLKIEIDDNKTNKRLLC